LASAFAVAYPVADLVVLVGMATVFLRASETLGRRACFLLGSGVAVYLIADALYSYLNVAGIYVDGSALTLWCEIPYEVALVLLSFGAYATTRRGLWFADASGDARPAGGSTSPLPYLSV